MNKTNLPNNLYELRRKAGLSQEEFAEKLGVSRQAVSKWERGEAYPDTENLITISGMFGVTIDELLNSDNIAESASNETEVGKNEEFSENKENDRSFRMNVGDRVNIDMNGAITVEDDDGKVKIDLGKGGIVVDDEDGRVKVDLGNGHIHIGSEDDGDDDDEEAARNASKLSIWYKVPYPIVTAIAFLLIGLLAEGWFWAWTLFITIPVYYSLLDAIRKRRITDFAYPVFIAFVYCLLGMLCHWWHPGWILFITIPVFYPIAEGIDRYNRNKKN